MTMVLVAALSFLLTTISIVDMNQPGSSAGLSSLIPHSPISINGDSDFSTQATSESWNGSGSAGDPYMIENYEIDAASSSCGIIISNTQSHFTIRNCSLYGASLAGIELLSVVNGTISNSTCFNNVQYGIYIVTSNLNSILGNNCSDNGAAGVCFQAGSTVWFLAKSQFHKWDQCSDRKWRMRNAYAQNNLKRSSHSGIW